ncbi:hypothetical protein BD410DRAFT_787771, partial [Rickenella mellea]
MDLNVTHYWELSASWPHLTNLLARSHPTLTSCEILGTPMIDEDIIRCLQRTPSLTTLSGDEHLFTAKVMDALTPCVESTKMPLCPILRTMELKRMHDGFS